MNILVTGTFGYFGRVLVRALAASGHAVTALGRTPLTSTSMSLLDGVDVIYGDIFDLDLSSRLRRCDAVVALHGRNPGRSNADPAGAVRDLVTATARVAEAAKHAGVKRMILASSIYVYGTKRVWPRPYLESDGPMPDDLYGLCKEAAEAVWQGFGGSVLRFSNLYGGTGGTGVADHFARAALGGETLTVYGDGAQKLDLLYVADAVRAVEAAVLRRVQLPRPVNIGGGAQVSIADLARAFAQHGADSASVEFVPAPEGKLWPDRSLGIERAHDWLDWSPMVDLVTGVKAAIAQERGAL